MLAFLWLSFKSIEVATETDLIGLDVALNIRDALHTNYKDGRYRAPILLRKMVQAGHLGRKTGKGFYEY